MKKATLLLISILGLMAINSTAQETVTMYMELPIGPGRTVTFMKDPLETELTSVPDDFFNVPMEPNYRKEGVQYVLVLDFPKEYNFFVFRVDNAYSDKAIVGCFSTQKDSSFCLKSFDYVDSGTVENSMEIYREALELEFNGKNRKANKLYQKAAEIGNVLAMMRLADHYKDGVGCVRNVKKAYYWYEQASYFGDYYSYSMIQGDSYRKKSSYSVMHFR